MIRRLSDILRPAGNRWAAFLLAALLLLLPFFAQAELTSFAIVSDTHVGSPDSVYSAFIRIIEEQKIETIIHLGDAIHNPGKSRQWKRFFEITGPGKTLHLVPGNHDIHGQKSMEVYLRFFPSLYYSFSDGDTLFVLLNTEIPGFENTIAGEQLAWLKTELNRPFKYKFVFLHQPLFPFWPRHGLDRNKIARDALHRLFMQKKVALVVSGHDHIYLRSEKGGITYVIAAPSGGKPTFYDEDNDFFRYITAKRTDEGYSFIVRDIDGSIKDEFFITR
ncbi:MAG: hypothetical protein C0392_09600 [Syntrophus sp. (in: bacteria)]|nr:hypothetical protein [Syntrophus sp. (in: bacteria)]